ncbi:hypothetical protein Cni_G16796 [Canna indica]|uniref:BHLH domain-containing protein n=1 Tax=Canna indica TaxID=4628 RepID=A0AAQ3KGM6_9LILI|nr:hypothetical protein Cni_G16796 [Canna indica]
MDQPPLMPWLPELWRSPVVGVPPMGAEESTITEQRGGSKARRRRRDSISAGGASEDESSKLVSTSSGGNESSDTEAKRLKTIKSTDENSNIKAEAEESSGIPRRDDQNPRPPEPQKQDYIHVRARRGQATDSHSLAERARREKISERMKILQDLVPGCNKVIGKASILDEIINYVQALQRQVEFLSMKLEAVNSGMNSTITAFPTKDFGVQGSTSSLAYSSQTREYEQGSGTEWLHMQIGGPFERVATKTL